MIKKLIQYKLDCAKTLPYVKEQLIHGNTLSKNLYEVINSNEGKFYSLLPEDADLNNLYEFEGGCILPQNKTHEFLNESGKKSSYTWIPTLKKEVGNYIFERLKKNENYVCIFEDVMQRIDDPHIDFYHQYGMLYSNEMYYFLNNKSATCENILDAIYEVNALWHLVFILTEAPKFQQLNKEITFEDIKYFSENSKVIVIGAYDGEGFVFWEPNSHS